MKLDNRLLHKLLLENGITHLHHANTVATSLTFLKQGGLLSRGAVQRRGLFQTAQKSDRKDRIYDVWNDIFLDTHDLHGHFPRQNLYGPVLFKFSIDFLLHTRSEIWVTKNNPVYWRPSMRIREKYFSSVREVRKTWDQYEPQKRMITIKNNSRPVFFKYLQEIILDDPDLLIDEELVYGLAKQALQRMIKKADLDVRIKKRTCSKACYCKQNYLDDAMSVQTLQRLFYPLENAPM
jgi:hypothetical protein